MKALILAGGEGTRLRPLTYTIPKQLVPVANKPILFYVLKNILRSGISDIGIVISNKTGEEIRKSILSLRKTSLASKDFNLTFIEQEKPLGLAHAVKISRDFLKDDAFVMYLGDNLIGEDISNFIKEFDSDTSGLILLKEVDNPRNFGVAVLEENGNIKYLVEKPQNPPSNLALVGVYIFSPDIHEAIDNIKFSNRGELEITDAISYLIKQGHRIKPKIINTWWLDTGKKDDILFANRIVLDHYAVRNIKGSVEESKVEGRVSIGKRARIKNSTLRGPIVIGDNTVIENSFIGPFTSVGEDCNIKNAKIEHSLLMNSVVIDGKLVIEDSLVGRNTSVKMSSQFGNRLKLLIGDDASIEI